MLSKSGQSRGLSLLHGFGASVIYIEPRSLTWLAFDFAIQTWMALIPFSQT